MASPQGVPPMLAPPVEEGRWIVPAAGAASEPVWGVKGGIAVGLWPTAGPRGLLRIYAPYLDHPPGRMINFIAVEPIVGNDRGFSELERSLLDNADGKAMWSGDDFEAAPQPRNPWQPARGRIIGSGNSEALVFYVFVERFNNGAQAVIKVMLRQDRPHEVSFTTYAAGGSAAMRACVLTATMGNFGRLRDLWLKGEVVRSTLVYNAVGLDGMGFLPHRKWDLDRMLFVNGEAVVAATSNEADPARNNGPDVADGWRYVGRPATQYWKTNPAGRTDLVVRVNARRTYWPDRTGSQGPIPGGPAYENFELEVPFRAGHEFRFGVTLQQPEALGFPASWRQNVTGGAAWGGDPLNNLEVVAREGGQLFHYWAVPGKPWIPAVAITDKATGAGAIARNHSGNLEVVVPEGGNLVHYWVVPGKPWNRGAVITTQASGSGSIARGPSGNLEVVVPEGSNLVHYWAVPGKPWNRGAVITTQASGSGSIAQGPSRNLEVVVPEGSNLVHYWAVPGTPWNRAAVITSKATGPGSLIQSRP